MLTFSHEFKLDITPLETWMSLIITKILNGHENIQKKRKKRKPKTKQTWETNES